MVAIGAGVGHDAHLDRGQRAVPLGAELDCVVIGCRVVAPMNCSARVNSHFTGRPVFSAASTQRSSVSISCLPPKPPPTRSVKTWTLRGEQPEQIAELLLGDERRLRTGADVEAAVLAPPGDRAVRLQVDVLDARGRVGHLVDGVGLRETAATLPTSPWIST